MESLYLYTALIGGTILVLQVIMLLVGFGDSDTDVDADVDVDTDVGHGDAAVTAEFAVISFKTLVAFFTFFGASGMLVLDSETFGGAMSLVISLPSGTAAMFIVAYFLQLMRSLETTGNVNINGAVGQDAAVYLRIPGDRQGAGKVTVTVQDREMEYQAMTEGAELPTGGRVQVVGVIDGHTLLVEPHA